jgi:chromosomal replication initiator protein
VTSQPVTIELARRVLGELFTTRRGQPTMEEILKLVTDEFGVKMSDLQSRRRTNAIAYPRQIGMYLARRVTRHSLEEIGGFFGGRDHSTVLYAVDKITRLVKEDQACRDVVVRFLDRLQGPAV